MQRENLIFKVGMLFGTVPYQPDRKGEGSTLTVSLTVKRPFFLQLPFKINNQNHEDKRCKDETVLHSLEHIAKSDGEVGDQTHFVIISSRDYIRKDNITNVPLLQ